MLENTKFAIWKNAQVLRLAAAFLIVFVHLEVTLGDLGVSENLINSLRVGTDCFFVLTAFLTVQKIDSSPNLRPVEWLLHRLIRILPLFWIMTLVSFAAKNLLMSEDNHHSFKELVFSMLLVPYDGEAVLYPAWSLTLIVEFAIIACIAKLGTGRWAGAVATVTVSTLGLCGLVLMPDDPILVMLTNPLLIDFAYGGALAISLPLLEMLPRAYRVNLGVLAITVGAAMVAATVTLHPDIQRPFTFGAASLLVVTSCILMELSGLAISSHHILKMANYTYCIYLCHIFWDVLLDKIAEISPEFITWLLIAFTPAIVLIGSAATYHLIERPIAILLMPKTSRSAMKIVA